MTILYINDEICHSLQQLKGYFNQTLTVESIVGYGLLEMGRAGDIAQWLREIDEAEIANHVEMIDKNLTDSEYIKNLAEVITGQKNA